VVVIRDVVVALVARVAVVVDAVVANNDIGVRVVNDNDEVEFLPINIIKDTNDGIWVTGIPNLSKLIVLGQGFVKNGEKVQTTFLSDV